MPIDVTLAGGQNNLPQHEEKANSAEKAEVLKTENNGTQQEPVEVSSPVSEATPTPASVSQNNTAPILDGVVNIPPDAPIVILFGPTSCGKSMALKRLTRYLRKSGDYQAIEPERSFRPANDTAYQDDCDKFDKFVSGNTKAAGSTGYMLVNVIEEGTTICRILEAPGEYYFDPSDPGKSYPNYMNTIITAPNPRIWCVFVEPNWSPLLSNDSLKLDPQEHRMNYVKRIQALKPMMQKNDEVLFVFNKIDETHFVITPGEIRMKQAVKFVAIQYPGIFNQFKNDIPILKWFKKYNCGFIPFQTGLYQEKSDVYADSVDDYPAMLWKAIMKRL